MAAYQIDFNQCPTPARGVRLALLTAVIVLVWKPLVAPSHIASRDVSAYRSC